MFSRVLSSPPLSAGLLPYFWDLAGAFLQSPPWELWDPVAGEAPLLQSLVFLVIFVVYSKLFNLPFQVRALGKGQVGREGRRGKGEGRREKGGGGRGSQYVLFLSLRVSLHLCHHLFSQLFHIFVIEEKHGFNKQTLVLFVSDLMKSFGLFLVLGLPITAALVWLVQWGGEKFHLWVFVFLAVLQVVMQVVYPNFIMPLFNKVCFPEPTPSFFSCFCFSCFCSFSLFCSFCFSCFSCFSCFCSFSYLPLMLHALFSVRRASCWRAANCH
jgi:hypothetical protein